MAKAPATAETVSATELGAMLDLSARRVRELAEAGVLRRHGRGRFIADEARADYLRHLRETAAGRAAAAGDGGLDLVAERARLAKAQADRQELELAVRRGQLVDAQDVRQRFAQLVTAAKTKLLGLPSAAKGRIPTLTVRDVDALDDLVRQALEELADGRAA